MDELVWVWDAVAGTGLLQVAGHRWGVVGGVESDGARVVASGGDGAVRVWDAVTGGKQLLHAALPPG
ncbi:MAG: WD40 repeat domain-containing protein [Actinomycetales bacterium]|nr:WD40 repeat domain-containing protein [Candidatus Phosphoribacter baldrii]